MISSRGAEGDGGGGTGAGVVEAEGEGEGAEIFDTKGTPCSPGVVAGRFLNAATVWSSVDTCEGASTEEATTGAAGETFSGLAGWVTHEGFG